MFLNCVHLQKWELVCLFPAFSSSLLPAFIEIIKLSKPWDLGQSLRHNREIFVDQTNLVQSPSQCRKPFCLTLDMTIELLVKGFMDKECQGIPRVFIHWSNSFLPSPINPCSGSRTGALDTIVPVGTLLALIDVWCL